MLGALYRLHFQEPQLSDLRSSGALHTHYFARLWALLFALLLVALLAGAGTAVAAGALPCPVAEL
jgi:hypothetical protein